MIFNERLLWQFWSCIQWIGFPAWVIILNFVIVWVWFESIYVTTMESKMTMTYFTSNTVLSVGSLCKHWQPTKETVNFTPINGETWSFILQLSSPKLCKLLTLISTFCNFVHFCIKLNLDMNSILYSSLCNARTVDVNDIKTWQLSLKLFRWFMNDRYKTAEIKSYLRYGYVEIVSAALWLEL